MQEESLVQFDDHQSRVINSTEKNIIVLARAGSGKSTVLIKRAEKLNKISPGNTLLISFSRDVAEDNEKNRLRGLKFTSSYEIKAKTIHSLSLELLNKYNPYKLKLINRNFCISFYRDLFGDWDYTNTSKIEYLYWLDSNLPQDYTYADIKKLVIKRFTPFSVNKLPELINLVRSERKQRGYILVGEILNQAKYIPKTVWQSLQIKHLMIDEAQDISFEQLDLLKPIIEQASTVTVVMDNWQEIYGWAGSDSKVLIDYLISLKNFVCYPLLYNYRSALNIVRLSNNLLISGNEDNTIQPTKQMRGLVRKISEQEFEDLIKYLNNTNNLDNTIILYRNYKCLDKIKKHLEGIPYSHNNYIYSKNIELVFNYYRLLFYINPPKYVWTSITRSSNLIGWRVSEYIWETTKGRPLTGIEIPNEPNLTRLYRSFCNNTRILREHIINSKPADSIDLILNFIKIKDLTSEELDILDKYKDLFSQCFGVYDILEIIDSKDKIFAKKRGLVLSTIHKAKGLEYNRVFLWADQLQGNRGGEELRLEYVAITRAKLEFFFVGTNKCSRLDKLMESWSS
jgi:superfamily I DNA/RNA helicase